MIDNEIQKEMLAYYNERAKEHDLVYTGKGPAIHEYSDEYSRDVARISKMASEFGNGNMIDIACGTGFWAPHYARNCSRITFVDQSERMLSECRNRVERRELGIPFHFIHGNFFDAKLPRSSFDCALFGFLLSHFTTKQEEAFFGKLRGILKVSARIMMIDSIWNEKRRKHRRKAGIEERVLEDGRVFRVYKKYFERSEVEYMLEKYHFNIKTLYVGEMLFAAIAERTA